MANGIAEAIRNYSMTITPRAMFSRAVSGIRNNTVIINLPGSPKAVKESLEFLLPNLEHGLGILTNRENEYGAPFAVSRKYYKKRQTEISLFLYAWFSLHYCAVF